jgi:APA family basic amino acid/polyamine antiporter
LAFAQLHRWARPYLFRADLGRNTIRVFAANLAALLQLESIPLSWLALGFILALAGVVFRGIRESMWVNALCTLVEALGLVLVVVVGFSYWGSVDYFETPAGLGGDAWLLVLQGAVLAFFAFIGFEDTINVAEECRDPGRTIPFGLIIAIGIAAFLYIAVAITAVSVVPWPDLAAAPGPITEVMRRAIPALPPLVFTGITLFAVANTALVNYVTASRLIYGMARQGLLPPRFGDVHADRRTPHIAIAALFLIAAPLALFGTIEELASATVLLLLVVFAIVNGALIVLKWRKGEPAGRFEIPRFVPAVGMLVCLVLVGVRVTTGDALAPTLAGVLLLGCVAIYALVRPSPPTEGALPPL